MEQLHIGARGLDIRGSLGVCTTFREIYGCNSYSWGHSDQIVHVDVGWNITGADMCVFQYPKVVELVPLIIGAIISASSRANLFSAS